MRKNKRLQLIRGHARGERFFPVEFLSSDYEQTQAGRLGSISQAGLFIHTHLVPDLESDVKISFRLYGRRVEAWGKIHYVCRVGDGFRPQGFGVRFKKMQQQDHALVKQLIDRFFAQT